MPAAFDVIFKDCVSEPKNIDIFGDVIERDGLTAHDILTILGDPIGKAFATLSQEFQTAARFFGLAPLLWMAAKP